MTRVSVLMPLDDASPDVRVAIDSVLRQSFRDLELIVIADNPHGCPSGIAEEFQDGRLRIVAGRRRGASAALDAGILAARGEIVMCCDPDGRYPAGRIESQVEFLDAHPEFGAVCGKTTTIDSSGRPGDERPAGEQGLEVTDEVRTAGSRIDPLSLAVRGEHLRSGVAGRVPVQPGQPVDLRQRVTDACRIYYIPHLTYAHQTGESLRARPPGNDDPGEPVECRGGGRSSTPTPEGEEAFDPGVGTTAHPGPDPPDRGDGGDAGRSGRATRRLSLASVSTLMKAVFSASDHAAKSSVRRKVAGGAFWTLASYGTRQTIRFGSHLILARLLLPDAFGLMALTTIVVAGLEMLSDVGLGPAVIQSRRGDDPTLLSTAWTVQIIRGFMLYGVALALAWPLAAFYGEAELRALILVVGLTTILRGLASIRIHTLSRRVNRRPLAFMEITVQATGAVIMIVVAWLMPSVWALVIGRLVADILRTLWSHLVLPGPRDRIGWDRQSVTELINVGRWIFLSTALSFGVGHLDRLSLGRFLTMAQLGVYSIAYMFCELVISVGNTVSMKVFFPVLAETVREDRALLYARLRKARLLWLIPAVAALVTLSLGGELLVRILYAERFHEAGWMLRILAAGSIVAVINKSGAVAWPALGEFRMITLLMSVQFPVLCGSMIIGYHLHGIVGVVIGVALVETLVYPLYSFLLWRRGLWQPEVDIPAASVCGAIIATGFWLV